MAQVKVRVNGREYDLTCGDGEEEHLRGLARYVDAKITGIRGSGANLSDAQLLLMAGIVISDELEEAAAPARKALADSQSETETLLAYLDSATGQLQSITAQLEAI